MSAEYELHERFRVTGDHPALAGHFPADPVVPGVVLLDRIAARLECEANARLSRIHAVKFLAPLRPGEDADLAIECDGTRVRFRIRRHGATILRGEGELA